MSPVEAAVVVFGVFLGYWIVSRFLLGGWSRRTPSGDHDRKPEESAPENLNSSSASWSETLCVAPDASVEEIRRAYRQLMSQYHPDKVAALGEELRQLAERKSKEIGQAYRDALRARGTDF